MFWFSFFCRVRAEIAVIIGADMNAYMMSRFSACILPVYDIIVKSPLCLRAKIEEALYCNLNRSLWHIPIHSYFEDIIRGHCGMPQSSTPSTSCRSLVFLVSWSALFYFDRGFRLLLLRCHMVWRNDRCDPILFHLSCLCFVQTATVHQDTNFQTYMMFSHYQPWIKMVGFPLGM